MDHKEITQKDSIESMESGYGSVETSNITKCDICDTICAEPIVVWFSKQRTGDSSDRPKSSLMSAAYLCHGCFTDNSPTMAEKLKQKSRLHGYRPTSINMSPDLQVEEVDTDRRKKSPVRDRLTFSVIALLALVIVVILFVLFVILMSTGTLQVPASNTGNEAVQSAALVQNVDDLHLKYLSLLEQMNVLANQTIKHQNVVDATLANHTMTLLEIMRNINKTDPNSRFQPGSNTECNYYKPRQRTSAAVSETRTPWYPTDDDTQVLITGVDCSVTGGTSSQLETRQQDGLTQYSCICPAQTNTDSLIHTCTIHIWSCS